MVEILTHASLCSICGLGLKPGEQVRTKSTPILFRYGKQKKKAKANTHITLMCHVKCYEELYEGIKE